MGSNRFPYESIAAMPPGDFWALPWTVGLPDEDVAVVARGGLAEAPAEQQRRIQAYGMAAQNFLRNVPVGQPVLGPIITGKPS